VASRIIGEGSKQFAKRVTGRRDAKVSMTQDRYMARGKLHPQVAELLERVISDE
jgi:hypothetical protein